MIEVKIPKTIKVGGFNYKILIDKVTDKELDCANLWGQHRPKSREICLSNTASSQQLCNTFIHEILHSANDIYRNSKLCEDDVEALSQGMFQVLEQLGVRFVK